jgi:hypothetical protein
MKLLDEGFLEFLLIRILLGAMRISLDTFLFIALMPLFLYSESRYVFVNVFESEFYKPFDEGKSGHTSNK